MENLVRILLGVFGILCLLLICASMSSCDTEEHGVVITPPNPWPSADKLLAEHEARNASPPLRKTSSSRAWFPTTPAGSALAWGAVLLTLIGGFITRSRGKLDYSAIPLALGVGILVFVVLRPTGFEFHLIPTSPWFWAALTFWGGAKIVPTRFAKASSQILMAGGILLILLLALAFRGIDPKHSYNVLNPAWWVMLAVWEIVLAERVLLHNEEMTRKPLLRGILLFIGWYILGILA